MEDETDTIEFNENKYLYSWGFGKYGQIGAKFVNYSLIPIQQNIDEKEEIICVSGGESHSAILTLSPTLYVYGKNYFGQLGLGNNHYICTPIKLELSEKVRISKVSCGGDHTLALTEDNLLFSWGLNAFGQLGLGDYLARKVPHKVDVAFSMSNKDIITQNNTSQQSITLSKTETIIDIAAGAQHSLILTSKNRIFTCGFSKFMSLGYESEEDVNKFNYVEGISFKNNITKIASGVYHSGCVVDNEVIYIWGLGEILKFPTPTPLVLNFTGNNSPNKKEKLNPDSFIRDLKISEDRIYVVNKNDEIYAMGDNKYDQLGHINTSPPENSTFIKIEAPKVKQLEVGYHFAMCITYDNKIYGWGSNEYGQLGITNATFLNKPTYLEDLSKMGVFKLACGGYHCLGLFNNTYVDPLPNTQPSNDIEKTLVELKRNLKMCSLNSTIRKDTLNNQEKFKFMESMKNRILEMEGSLQAKDSELKDLKAKEEELSKIINDSSVVRKPMTIDNPRGFDNNFEISLEEIELPNEDLEIGRGTFGDVRRGYWRKEHVAIKFLKPEMTNSDDNINAFTEECNMLKNMRHPNILLFMGASTTPPYYFIVTEFCENGNLFELLHQHKNISLNWEEKRRIGLEIALGMNYLHSFQPPILHRDLKSMNLLLDKNFQIKIADFGSTKFLDIQMTKQKGTFQWMAPEVIKSNNYTEKADVFSFGIIMNELACRQPPYYGVDKKEVARNVATKPDYRPSISRSYPKEWVELMVKCWDHYPNKRPSFNDIVDSLIKMKLTR